MTEYAATLGSCFRRSPVHLASDRVPQITAMSIL